MLWDKIKREVLTYQHEEVINSNFIIFVIVFDCFRSRGDKLVNQLNNKLLKKDKSRLKQFNLLDRIKKLM